MRRLAALAGTIVAAGVLAGPSSAGANDRTLDTQMHVLGTVVAVWKGDTARGCAAAGVCGVSGSATFKPGATVHVSLGRSGAGQGGSGLSAPTVIRVRDTAAGGANSCADVIQPIFSPVSIEPSGGSIAIAFDQVELSSGRCAGPRMLDLANGLPRGSIRAAPLRKHGRVLDLSSDTRFAAGPFSGSVRSTVRIAFTRLRARRDRLASRIEFVPSKRYRRYAGVELDYRIASVAGAVTTDFRGVPGTACTALGACGATGSSAYSIAGARGDISLIATRRLRKGERPPSFRKGLHALRRGALPLLAFAELSRGRVTVAERFASPAGACSDSLFAEAPGVDVLRREGSLALAFRSSGGFGADSLRTRCPGPAEQDAIGNGSIALGKVGLAALGQRRLRVAAMSARSFARGGYAGQRHGQLDVSLELEWAGTVTGIG